MTAIGPSRLFNLRSLVHCQPPELSARASSWASLSFNLKVVHRHGVMIVMVTCCVHWQVLVLAAAGSLAMMGTPVLAAMNSPPSWMLGGPTCSTTGTTGWLGVKCDSDPSATNQRLTEIDLTIAGPGGTPWTTGAGQLGFGSLSSEEALAFLMILPS